MPRLWASDSKGLWQYGLSQPQQQQQQQQRRNAERIAAAILLEGLFVLDTFRRGEPGVAQNCRGALEAELTDPHSSTMHTVPSPGLPAPLSFLESACKHNEIIADTP